MKDTARKKDARQESPHIGQLALAAMFDARATLYETVINAGMSVLAGMLEDDRTRLCGPRYEHDPGVLDAPVSCPSLDRGRKDRPLRRCRASLPVGDLHGYHGAHPDS
jgi:hypothetical protein